MQFPPDCFGDTFVIDQLPLPRPAIAYGVQRLDTDTVLDSLKGRLVPIRQAGADCCFSSFPAAYQAACEWTRQHIPENGEHQLAIVPLGYDPFLERLILIYGVLCSQP